MPKTAIDLEVHEVSLVGNPANPESKIVLTKSARVDVVTKKDGPVCRLCETPVGDEDRYCRSCGAPFYKSGDPDDKEKNMEENVDGKTEESVATPEGASKADTPATPATPVAKAEVMETVSKSDFEALQKTLDEVQKSLVVERRIAKVKATRDTVEATMKSIPAETDELAENLVQLAEKAPELAAYFEGLLTKSSELVSSGQVLEQVASSATTTAKTADDIHKAKVEELVASGMSRIKAEAEAWTPELVEQYEKEKREAK